MRIVDFGFVTAEVTEKNVKYMRITIVEEGKIRISVPPMTDFTDVSDFVCKNEQWISDAMKRKANKKEFGVPNFTDDKVLLWGIEYPAVYENGRSARAELVGDVIKITCDFGSTNRQTDVMFAVDELYFRELTKRIRERLPVLEQEIGLFSSSVSIRKMKTRWGSCTPETKSIRFELNLASKPQQCLDFVIVHELGHILYPNHGKEFYQYMDLFYPEWKKAKELLWN